MKNPARQKFSLLLAILLIFGAIRTDAQSALLKGRIYSAENYENISHANVVIKNGEGLIITSITTGYDGRYETDSIEPGAYRVEITSNDFGHTAMNNIYLQSGKAANFDFALATTPDKKEEDPAPKEVAKKSDPNFLDILGGILRTSLVGR